MTPRIREKTIRKNDEEKGRVKPVDCVNCNRTTDHEVLTSISYEFEINEFEEWQTYEIIECRGCHTVSFRKTSFTEDDIFDVLGPDGQESGEREVNVHEELFPKRKVDRPKIIQTFLRNQPIPKELYDIYDEVYQALLNEQIILCGAGLRILLERICKDRKATGNNLEDLINDLKKKEICSGSDALLLHGTRLFGNEVAHQSPPNQNELSAAFDVLEHLLNTIYILPSRTQALKERGEKNELKK
jgi:hypothetical protein